MAVGGDWNWRNLVVGMAITTATLCGLPAEGNPVASAPSSMEVASASRPTASDVAAMMAHDVPVTIAVAPNASDRPLRQDLIDWEGSYEHVPIVADIKSSKTATGWVTRWHRSRQVPPPFHAESILSDTSARGLSGLPLDAPGLRVRRVYWPTFGQIHLKEPPSNNAVDYDIIIDSYRAALEVTDNFYRGAIIDAHSGAVIQRLGILIN